MTQVALTIAGSDPSGGAGIQADLKTFHAHGVYGAAAITLLTVQNTMGVSRVEIVDPALVREQIDAVTSDLPVAAVKTGALGNADVIRAVASAASDFGFPLVIDPVMISKHGAPLIANDAIGVLRERLMPLAALITPNAPEAAALTGMRVESADDARRAAEALVRTGARAVLIKGGHLRGDASDYLLAAGEWLELPGRRIATVHTHGTGCTYSAAITARLARGDSLADAVRAAKAYIAAAIETAPGLGGGAGPVNHFSPPL